MRLGEAQSGFFLAVRLEEREAPMDIGVLHFGVCFARGALPAAVCLGGGLAREVLRIGPGQGESSCAFVPLQQLGMRHASGADRFPQFGPQGLVPHNIGEQHGSKVLRNARRPSLAGCALARKCLTQRCGNASREG